MSDRDIRRREREARGAPRDPEAEARLAAAQARGGADPRPRALEALERLARGFDGQRERLAGLAEVGWGWVRAGDPERGAALAIQALGGPDEPVDLAIRTRARAGATLVRAGDETTGWNSLRLAVEHLAVVRLPSTEPGWRTAAQVIEAWSEASGAAGPALPRADVLCAQVAQCDEPLAAPVRSRLARALTALGLLRTLTALQPSGGWPEPRRILNLHRLGGLGAPLAEDFLRVFQQSFEEGAFSPGERPWGMPPVTDRDDLTVEALSPCVMLVWGEPDAFGAWAGRLESQGAMEMSLVLEAEWLHLRLAHGDREVGLDRVERLLIRAAEHLGPCGRYAAAAARALEPLGLADHLDRGARVAAARRALELALPGAPRDLATLLEQLARLAGALGALELLERAAESAIELLNGNHPELGLAPLAAAAETAARLGHTAAPILERIGELVRGLHLRRTHPTAACLARCAWSGRALLLERAATWLEEALARVPAAADGDRLVEAILDHAGPASRREALARLSEALTATPQPWPRGRDLLPAIGLIAEHLGNDHGTLGAWPSR